MAKDNTMIILGVAGAGVAIYFATRKQHEAKVATAIAKSKGVAVPAKPPSLVGAAYGVVSDAAKLFLSPAKLLDAAMKQRGPAHYKAWSLAIKKGQPFYDISDPSGAVQCFVTATGAKAPITSCPATQLEGYF